MNSFNERLKQAMNLKNISQSELCELTGIPKSAMSQYVSGAFTPKQERTYLISKALNVNEAWLLGYDNVPMEKEHSKKRLALYSYTAVLQHQPHKTEALPDAWRDSLRRTCLRR